MDLSLIHKYDRVGTMPHRSYYIPFAPCDEVGERLGILDRSTSSRFILLDGDWYIKEHSRPDDVVLSEELTDLIDVPSSVQMRGYDRIQYLNTAFPIPAMPPFVPRDNPTWHYRRSVAIDKKSGMRYYLNFEGVDSAFYVYVNGVDIGYSQISHATSEFDVTESLTDGENVIDVIVLKWCASTYLECQDKFRFSGIFRSVYLLERPENHITDYKIDTELLGSRGRLNFLNESEIDVCLVIEGITALCLAGEGITIDIDDVTPWTSENPKLYTLRILTEEEKITEYIGFREVTIDGCVFKINGEAVKLKGVNRHDFNCENGAAVSLENMHGDIMLMKELNANAVRTSHYPNSPEFYLLCDRYGIYVIDEADLETHGACNVYGGYDLDSWSKYAENDLFAPGISDRHRALVERDKNRVSVIMWSLGNESSFGAAFLDGARYIKSRDTSRPLHYEGLQYADNKYYYHELIDVVSMMYPSLAKIKSEVLDNPEEVRPFLMCEYTHAMGNSCGDVADYWKLIMANEQMMGGFVWEWADHAVKTERGFLYGGDFGETEHDGNFCVDGLLTTDRKFKSATYEVQAVYGGKLEPGILDFKIPEISTRACNDLTVDVDQGTALIRSISADGKEIIKSPVRFNILRYIDNERMLMDERFVRYKLDRVKPYVISHERVGTADVYRGVLAANTMYPCLSFTIGYSVSGNELAVDFEYEIADYIDRLPRVGLEFDIASEFSKFSYVGYGPHESYVDKRVASDLGFFTSCADENYDHRYVRPQESGSHTGTEYLQIDGLFSLVADAPFSFSVNPYSTADIMGAYHDFELPESDKVTLCLDLAMRGVGSHSCGPELEPEYDIPKKGRNKFKFYFN